MGMKKGRGQEDEFKQMFMLQDCLDWKISWVQYGRRHSQGWSPGIDLDRRAFLKSNLMGFGVSMYQ